MTHQSQRPLAAKSDARPAQASFAQDRALLDESRIYLTRKLGLGRHWNSDAPRLALRERLARQLLAFSLAHPSVPARPQEPAVATAPHEDFDRVMGPFLLQCFERSPEARWLVTESLILKYLHQSNRSSDKWDPNSVEGERLQAARSKALEDLKGGDYPLQRFLAASASGAVSGGNDFMGYLTESVKHKTQGAFRSPLVKLKFWESKDSLDESNSDDDLRRPELKDPSRSAERALRSVQRADARRKAILTLRDLAYKGAHATSASGKAKPDASCVVVLALMDWLLNFEGSLPERGYQKAFGDASGIPTNTIGSAVSRFKERYAFAAVPLREALIYTTHGGSRA